MLKISNCDKFVDFVNSEICTELLDTIYTCVCASYAQGSIEIEGIKNIPIEPIKAWIYKHHINEGSDMFIIHWETTEWTNGAKQGGSFTVKIKEES